MYVTDDCLYLVKNYKRDPDAGSLSFQDELSGSPLNGDGLGCLKSLSFATNGVSEQASGKFIGTKRMLGVWLTFEPHTGKSTKIVRGGVVRFLP